ncbi:MAG: hypothetical protein EOO07_22010 [Chitinophagaceae bacterium]|nr:MAG: hypothetical protein EOO07_22010 [Chitinophagaceae bacterium]
MPKKCLLRFLFLILTAFASILAIASEDVMYVRHYDQGYTPSIKAYQRDLLQLMLQNTVPSFGAYSLELFTTPLSTNRSKLTLQQGDQVNILFASEWQGLGVSDEQVLSLELPIYYGLHGLRQLIVRTQDREYFSKIKTLEDFKILRCGQGARWLDVNIYRANNIVVNEGQSFVNLMPMLQKRRFDYLPLSVLETDRVFSERAPELKDLIVLDDLMIFYPLPSFLFFPTAEQRLLERLRAGFADIEKRGELLPLFESHFSSVPKILSGQRKRLIMLDNPGLTAEKNAAMKNTFLLSFGRYFEVLL